MILKSERLLVDTELDQLLAPFSLNYTINTYFLHQLRGDETAAAALWKESLEKGMPLPPL